MPEIILNFESYYGVFLVICVILPILFLYGVRVNIFPAGYSCQIDNSRQLQGVFILIVVAHHIAQRLNADILSAFECVGYLSVGVFFILSGYGLAKSLQKRKNYLQGFIVGKMLTLLYPFFLINLVTTLLLFIFGVDLKNLFKFLFSLRLIDTTLWFIASIFIFYCFFYISFKLKSIVSSIGCLFLLSFSYIAMCKFLELKSWWYVSSLCFPLGVMLGFAEVRLSALFSHKAFKLSFFMSSLATVFLLGCFQEKFWFFPPMIKSILFAMSILILASYITLKSFLASFVGGLSLEVYLLHMKLLLIFSLLPEMNSGIWVICYLSALILSASLFNKFNRYAINYFREI